MRNFSLGLRISGTTMLLTALVAIFILILVGWQGGKVRQAASQELNDLTKAQIEKIVAGIQGLGKAQAESILRELKGELKAAQMILDGQGRIGLTDEKTTWKSVNQFTKKEESLELPTLKVGDSLIAQVFDPAKDAGIVDEVTRMTEATCTIFQRIPGRDDMLRVSTSVLAKSGKRAIGTFIPAVHDRKPNQVIKTVLAGQTYFGRAFVVDDWYITAYKPLIGSGTEIIGMLYVGVKEKEVMAALREVVLGTKVGRTGYAFVLGAKGANQGHYIISKGGQSDGRDIWGSKDADGRPFIQEMVKGALAAGEGAVTWCEYSWQNPGEKAPRPKISAVTYLPQLNWIIGAGAYLEEINGPVRRIEGGINRMLRLVIYCGVGFVLLALGVSLAMTRSITRPINRIIGTLTDGSTHLAAASGQVASTSSFLADGASQQAAAMEASETTLGLISGQTRTNADNAAQARQFSGRSRGLIKEAGGRMEELAGSMEELAQSGARISQVVQSIDEISFQTNLLALNAAVEAARAGQAGAGFAVVADEVRALALRAAEAAKKTQNLIDETTAKIGRGAELTEQTRQSFKEVDETTINVDDLVGEIAAASAEQAENLRQTEQGLVQMGGVIQQSAGHAEEGASASTQLRAQADLLQDLVVRLSLLVHGARGRDQGSAPEPAGPGEPVPTALIER